MANQAEFTDSGTRSTSGDGTAVIAAPASDKLRWHLTSVVLTVDDPGTDEVTATLKSGEDVKLPPIVFNDSLVGFAAPVEIVCGYGEAVYLNLSAAVDVHWSISGYLRSDGRPELS
ncbi:MAG: hypothetical protein KDE20_14075 [Caldilineaceae bacterium]|nr:hypothetical protein [Caldilineaceae bacterium]